MNVYAVHSARPSSRGSIHSSNSISSYINRRPSSAPQSGSKGVLVSTSRSGAARSAAILLISCHISASNGAGGKTQSDDNMTKYLQKQLKHQRQLLHLELPSLYGNTTLNKFRKQKNRTANGNCSYSIDFDESDDDGISLDAGSMIEMGAVPTPASETAKVAVIRKSSFSITITYIYVLSASCF